MRFNYTGEKAYYNLRKRYGKDKARQIMQYWNRFHVDPPKDADQAIKFYIGVAE
ncbi:MAG: hypothetical protein QXV17_04390 [Candidatus Micrarchaeaceae archaeon]